MKSINQLSVLTDPVSDHLSGHRTACPSQRRQTTSGSPLVQVRALSVSYRHKRALQRVDLDIHAGRVMALVGPSGCGKTSFLNCLNRLTDMTAGCSVSGRILIDGADITGPNVNVTAVRRSVGLIFQKPNPFPLSVRENIYLPLRDHGCRDRQRLGQIAEEVLRETGLWEEVCDRLDQPAFQLSGGQQQRLCIARALALRPRILLMDEPCGALDPLSTDVIEQLIKKMRGRYTVVIVTHNLAQARRLADDLVVFWTRDGCGCLIEAGPARRVFENPQDPNTAAYLHGRRG